MRMKTLIVQAPAIDIHSAKDRAPSATGIFGAAVFCTDVLQALLKYGTYDIWFKRRTATANAREALAQSWNGDRTRILDSENIGDLAELDRPVLTSEGPDVLHHQQLRAAVSPRRDWPITGIIHSLETRHVPWWMVTLAYGDTQPWDALICSSTAGRTVIEHYLALIAETYPRSAGRAPSIRLPLIPCGADLVESDAPRRAAARQALGIGDDDTVFLYLGRMSTTLKCDLIPLVAAFAGMEPRLRARARLLIAGDDTYLGMSPSVLTTAAQFGCGDSVLVRSNPTHAEKLDLFHAADVFVSPTDHTQETFGLTIVEAMAAGLPVIASDWDGQRDLVDHGETGFLVPTYWTDLGDSFEIIHLCGTSWDGVLSGATTVDIASLRAYMEALAVSKDRRRTMGAQAQRRFRERFHWPVVVQSYEALWNDLRAHAQRDAGPGRPLTRRRTGVQHMFAHYPSEMLSDACVVRAGMIDSTFDAMVACADAMHVATLPSFTQIVAALRHELSREAEITLGELVARLCTAELAGELTVRLVLARLLKLGFLQPSLPRIQRGDRSGSRTLGTAHVI